MGNGDDGDDNDSVPGGEEDNDIKSVSHVLIFSATTWASAFLSIFNGQLKIETDWTLPCFLNL